ncbi:AI-2E family transporter [Microbacterium sp.]|uniref:AI-2E family transporter n=1 Tax=Microbacterium sp. TaxID=51671 RepID=UPI0025D751DE|nr:AI-2E family transporter [Microbacterium sp.]
MKVHNPFRVALVATLGVGVGMLLIGSVQTLSTILLYVGTALFLSLGLEPAISFLERRKLPRWAAVLITILGVLAAFAGIVLMLVPIIASQISQLIEAITKAIESGTTLDDFKTWLGGVFPNLNVNDVFAFVEDWVSNLDYASIGQGVLAVGASVLAGLAGAFIVLILTIYFTASTPNLKAAIYQLVPASKRARFIDIAEQITKSVGYFVMGQVTMGVINGVLSAIFLSIIGAPFPAVLAVVAFFFSLIPLVGTLTGSAIIVLTCLGLGSPTTALIAGIYYLVYMQIEAYVISPRVMNRAVSVPGAVVVIAALAGGSLLGLLGALIAIPVAASILIIYRQVIIPRQNER